MGGINMVGGRRDVGRYGAIDAGARAFTGAGAASRSSRRCRAGSTSGHALRRWRRPVPSRHCRNAIGPRQRTCIASTATLLTVEGKPAGWITIDSIARRASLRARQLPHASAANASGHAAMRGISDASTENAAAKASSSNTAINHRDGRHSSWQGTDALDERVECGIGGDLMAKEPAPELIVLAVQQL